MLNAEGASKTSDSVIRYTTRNMTRLIIWFKGV